MTTKTRLRTKSLTSAKCHWRVRSGSGFWACARKLRNITCINMVVHAVTKRGVLWTTRRLGRLIIECVSRPLSWAKTAFLPSVQTILRRLAS